MKRAQILLYGDDEQVRANVHEVANARSIALRDVRHAQSCLNMLRREGASVLVLKLGTNVEEELALLAKVVHLFRETAVIVVGDVDYPALAGVCWDLGAAYVLFPPEPLPRLREIIAGFLPRND